MRISRPVYASHSLQNLLRNPEDGFWAHPIAYRVVVIDNCCDRWSEKFRH